MCKCNPSIRTPWCGKGDCVRPKQETDSTGAMASAWFGTHAPDAVDKIFGQKPKDHAPICNLNCGIGNTCSCGFDKPKTKELDNECLNSIEYIAKSFIRENGMKSIHDLIHHADTQLGPKSKDAIVEAVRKDLLDRSELGIKKYGTALSDSKEELRAKLQHAYEECLDQANYLKWAIMELDKKDPSKCKHVKGLRAFGDIYYCANGCGIGQYHISVFEKIKS